MQVSTGLRRVVAGVFMTFLFLFSSCGNEDRSFTRIPPVPHPEENPFSEARAKLGEQLFFDKRLSVDNSLSCAGCHRPELAFTDGLPLARGVYGRQAMRNTPSILNSGYLRKLMYDAGVSTLEMQALVPLLEHTEMGMDMRELIAKLDTIAEYRKAARALYDRDFDPYVLTRSLSTYERTLTSFGSRFDAYYFEGKDVLTASEKKGYRLFTGKLNCVSCHALPLFTNGLTAKNGYYQSGAEDAGVFRVTQDSSDIGSFKVPSLRNVAITAPYMHDGNMADLREVIRFYQHDNLLRDNRIPVFTLSKTEEGNLLDFLKSLTDTSYLDHPFEN